MSFEFSNLSLQEKKILLKQLKAKLKVLSPIPINKKQIARQVERNNLERQTRRLQQKLYYIKNKEKLNQNRKLYMRTKN